jgi:tetratricopeptide (TPR) repeat protein
LKARRNVIILTLGSLAILLLAAGVWLRPRALALYHQVKGGQMLAAALAEASQDDPAAFACTLAPVTDEAAQRQLLRAVGHLRKAVEYDPNLAQAYLLLGRAECLRGEGKEAVEAYEAYTRLRPGNALGHLEAGFGYEVVKDTNAEISALLSAQISIQNLDDARKSALRIGDAQDALSWYQRLVMISGESIDTISEPFGIQITILDCFVSKAPWKSYRANTEKGNFEVAHGVLEIFYENTPEQRDTFSFASAFNIPIWNYEKLLIKLKGDQGTLVSIETVIDGDRTRPISYKPVPYDWQIWELTLQGKYLNEIVVGTGENAATSSPQSYMLLIDWIAIQ